MLRPVRRPLDRPRSLCRAAWWVVAAPLALLGLAGCYLQVGPVGCVLMAGLIGGAVAFVLWQMKESGVQWCRWAPVPAGLACGGLAIGVTGLIAIFEAAGLAISVLLIVAGWATFGRLPRRAARAGQPDGAPRVAGPPIEVLPPDPLPEPASLPTLSTAQLCWVWRISYVRVNRAVFPGHLEHLADVRRACLAELQRRDPVAFGRWFPTARAASDPARFFCHQPQT